MGGRIPAVRMPAPIPYRMRNSVPRRTPREKYAPVAGSLKRNRNRQKAVSSAKTAVPKRRNRGIPLLNSR